MITITVNWIGQEVKTRNKISLHRKPQRTQTINNKNISPKESQPAMHEERERDAVQCIYKAALLDLIRRPDYTVPHPVILTKPDINN